MSCRNDADRTLFSMIILMLLAGFIMPFCMPVLMANVPQSAKKSDEQRLTGRWIRLDGGYILEVKEIGKDGILKAAYYNPRSIKVGRAEFHRKQGKIALLVELRDVNYPGSTYNLLYDPKTDRLTGTYYQAVYGETYQIEFKRAK